MNVLIVDDEVEAANFFGGFLRRLGLNVEKANCGQEALKLFSSYKPEWVFLDFKMSDMNGLELLKKMKEINANIKAILISGREDNSIRDEAQALGVSDYLVKPIDLDKIHGIIKKHIPEQNTIN